MRACVRACVRAGQLQASNVFKAQTDLEYRNTWDEYMKSFEVWRRTGDDRVFSVVGVGENQWMDQRLLVFAQCTARRCNDGACVLVFAICVCARTHTRTQLLAQEGDMDFIRWVVAFPWPFHAREYVLE